MMKKATIILLFFICFKGIAQLPGKLDSLIKDYEKLKEDTLKVERMLYIATETSAIDTALSGKYGRRAYNLAVKINDVKGIGNSYNYFGRMYYQTQNYDEAIQCFDKAAAYFEKCKFLRGTASAFTNCGVIYNEKGDFDKALEYQQKSLEINIKTNNQEAVGNNYLNMGNTSNMKGDYESAMKFLLKAETIYTKNKLWEPLATAYYNIAYVMYNLRQNKKAIEYVNKSLKLREEKTFNKIGMAYSHVFLASIYSDTTNLNIEKANYHYKKVIELCKETGDRITLLSSYINIAKLYYNQEKPDSALPYCKSAIDLSREINNQKFLTSSLYYTGQILIKLNKHSEAIKFYKEGFDIAIKIGDDESVANSAQGLAACYYQTGNHKLAYEFLFNYTQKKDMLYNKDNLQTISEMEAKYENEKKQLEIENLNKDKKIKEAELILKEKENASKNKLIIFGAISLLGISVFAFFAYKNFIKTKKQNTIIENQKLEVELKNEEIVRQKDLVLEKQTEIIDSINYAKRIQQAVLTGEDVWKKISNEYFILFQPKDIVSGDFYWAYNTANNRSIFALADCTGHGVPGGFMSMLGNSFLNEIIIENRIYKADEILNRLRAKIINALEQKGKTQQKDGMDISLCVWNKIDNTLEFAGANNPMWIVTSSQTENELESIEIKADKMPIGAYLDEEKPFTSKTIQLKKGDVIFLSTDGYADQFGGPNGKKYKYKALIDSLIKGSKLSMNDQKEILKTSFDNWKNNLEQIDDVSIIGIRVV